ncbi:MAG: hypothetical protein ABSB74_15910 [Tepidisphaeraceae bacterium]|jgi:hypothetical protein
MSDGIKTRIEKLEAAAGVACPHCGRLCSDGAERARLNVFGGFDYDRYAELFRARIERERRPVEERARELLAEGWRP